MKLIDVGNYLFILSICAIVIYLIGGLKFDIQRFFNVVACVALLETIILRRVK